MYSMNRTLKLKFNGLNRQEFIVVGILVVIVAVITAQRFLLGQATYYNNFLIIKQSFYHLIGNKDLYQLYPGEYFDYYKYSPSFALVMAPIAFLPNVPGLFLWNLLNVLVLFFALLKLPGQTDRTRLFLLGFILPALITSLQNSQSNCLIAGLLIFSFILLEKKQIAFASLLIVFTIFIKIFGIVALSLFLFYPHKLKAVFYTILWMIILAILPLMVVSFSQLIHLYQSWSYLLTNDQQSSWGISVSGLLHAIFDFKFKTGILLAGVVLFCLPLLKYRFFSDLKFRLFFLSSMLIWTVIFNHKAESPTFIIAITGVAIWFFSQKLKTVNVILVILAFFLSVLSPTDLFPAVIRKNLIAPYNLMALPCILIWLKIIFDLFFYRKDKTETSFTSPVRTE